jgi:hypothetical protein
MTVLDPGHTYLLRRYDLKRSDTPLFQKVQFVKRMGEKYPGNKTSQPGTIVQEVLRMLIHRAGYLDKQEHWEGNEMLIQAWQIDLFRLERRAAERHGPKTEPDYSHGNRKRSNL